MPNTRNKYWPLLFWTSTKNSTPIWARTLVNSFPELYYLACGHINTRQPSRGKRIKHGYSGKATSYSTKTLWTYIWKLLYPTWIQGLPHLHNTWKWGQEHKINPVVGVQNPMAGTIMIRHHFDTGLIPMDIIRHPSENIVVVQPQDDNNISNNNQVSDIR